MQLANSQYKVSSKIINCATLHPSLSPSLPPSLSLPVPPTIIGVRSSKVSNSSNLVISFNITRASPLVELGDIVWSFISINDPERTLIILNVSCSEMGGATCDDAHRYQRYNFTFYHNETSLVIENAQVEDYGQFILTVSNPAGVTNYTHALRVNGKWWEGL